MSDNVRISSGFRTLSKEWALTLLNRIKGGRATTNCNDHRRRPWLVSGKCGFLFLSQPVRADTQSSLSFIYFPPSAWGRLTRAKWLQRRVGLARQCAAHDGQADVTDADHVGS
jgi:hypothetical protein